MAELIAGALVAAGIDFLIEKLSGPEVIAFFKHQKLDDGLLKKTKATMRSVNKLLNDAEEKQITNPFVKDWLDDLKDAVFQADDFLDEIAYDAMLLELEAGPRTPQTCTDQMRSFLSSFIPCKKGMGEMQLELERILQRLEDLLRQKNDLDLKELIGGTSPTSERLPTTSLVDASGVYGRDSDKKTIIELLQSNCAKGRRYDVISIVGMPGVGKTTLAKLVYNDIQELFDLKAWVYVSEKMDVLKVIKDILKELAIENCDNTTENQLHTKMQEKLKDKKVLLVLDDVWSEDKKQWDFLLQPFTFVKQGSKILITTRHQSVASVRSTVRSHILRELSEEDCWLVFEKHAFVDGNSNEHPDLKEIGREIVNKCQGLPLAAEALGALLSRGRRDVEYWETILNNNLWFRSNNDILPALRLSYHYLPPQLKECFAYCGMIPKGSEIPKKIIVLLWMAEGFLGDKKMEEVGDQCFNDLVSRSFFRPLNDDPSRFVMHDLLHDLAKFVAGEFCFMMEGEDSCQPNERTRYLSGSEINSNAFERIFEASNLRSLFMDSELLKEGIMYPILSKLKRLRVLSLEFCESLVELPDSVGNLKHLRLLYLDSAHIERLPETVSKLHHLQTLVLDGCPCLTELPDSIGKLKHLRWLSLQKTSIERLPESTSALCNLETLNLHGCRKFVELPADMMKLSNLCNLDIGDTGLQSMPSETGKLVKLKQLSDFFLAKQHGSSIEELGTLTHLRGELCIWNLQNVENVRYASAANLKGKKQLEKLKLTWNGDTGGSLHHGILEQLQPHTNVKSITIVGYGSDSFPKWVGDSSFSNMVTLHLDGCKNLSSLPPLGNLSSLEKLSIKEFCGVTVIGPEFYGGCSPGTKPFASLKYLKFEGMTELQQWQVEDGAFSVLRDLYICSCSNLTTMPSYFPNVITLEIQEYRQFPPSLPRCPVIDRMRIYRTSSILGVLELNKSSSGLYRLAVEGPILQQVEQTGRCPHHFEFLGIRYDHRLEYFPLNSYPNLKSLYFDSCRKLKTFSLESHLKDFVSLTSLDIYKCPNFCFPTGGLAAPNLTHLRISYCSILQALPESMHSLLPSLENLEIYQCPELESFPRGGLPSKLQSLDIVRCDKLIANRMQWGLQRHPSLSKFSIGGFEDVESFPEETLLPSTLTSLRISRLENLKSLDYKGLQHLTCLIKLEISKCPNLLSLPEEGSPSSLSSLEMVSHTNLESLDCKGLSSSLSSLIISDFKNLKSLDYKWIQSLTSLRALEIWSCPVLQSFPDEGLPSSLSSLTINFCPLLRERCEKEKGDYWPRICHIPHIEIDHRKIN